MTFEAISNNKTAMFCFHQLHFFLVGQSDWGCTKTYLFFRISEQKWFGIGRSLKGILPTHSYTRHCHTLAPNYVK